MLFNRSLIAIDIGSSAIKVVELGGKHQKKLLAMGLELLPPGVVVDGMIQSQAEVEHALQTTLKKLNINPRGRRVALSLGGSSVIIKKVMVTSTGADLAEQVYYEAEQNFQADMSELYFDYAELGGAIGPNGERAVLLIGARRDIVEQYVGVIRAVGMRTAVIECAVFSAANMFEFNYGQANGLVGLVNVGASVTQLSLIYQGEYIYTRDISIAGEEYSRQIMALLGVDRNNAEGLKLAVSAGEKNAPAEIAKLIGEINEQLVGELQMNFDYFFQSGDPIAANQGLSAIFLTGGTSRMLGLDASIAAAFQVPVQILNPLQKIHINSKKFQLDYVLMHGHLYGVAVGLALRSMSDRK